MSLVMIKDYMSEYYTCKPEPIQHFINKAIRRQWCRKYKEKSCREFLKCLY